MFGFDELLLFFALAISLALAYLGDAVFRVPHVPIGSKVGKIAVSAVAGQREIVWTEWCSKVWGLFCPTGWDLAEAIFTRRYVDDAFMITDILCVLPKPDPDTPDFVKPAHVTRPQLNPVLRELIRRTAPRDPLDGKLIFDHRS